jgi:hypothetical protein
MRDQAVKRAFAKADDPVRRQRGYHRIDLGVQE